MAANSSEIVAAAGHIRRKPLNGADFGLQLVSKIVACKIYATSIMLLLKNEVVQGSENILKHSAQKFPTKGAKKRISNLGLCAIRRD